MREEFTNKTVLRCNCGCGSLVFEQFKSDGYTILSYEIPAFFAYQETFIDRLKVNWKLIWAILTGERYRLFEIIIESDEELNKFKEFVSNMRGVENGNS